MKCCYASKIYTGLDRMQLMHVCKQLKVETQHSGIPGHANSTPTALCHQ